MAELDALNPQTTVVKLESGFPVELERLKARQFFKLLRIVTSGAFSHNLSGFGDLSQAEFMSRFVTLVLLSIPEAEDETIEFVKSMCKPEGLIERRNLNKQDQGRNEELWAQFDENLDNPELDDLVTIIEAVVKQEAEDIQALGKRLAAMFNLAERTGQLPKDVKPGHQSPKESTEAFSEGSAELSTSSPASTAGTASKTSSTSRSRGSAKSSTKSRSAASTRAGSGING
jgi:hypothetical protein